MNRKLLTSLALCAALLFSSLSVACGKQTMQKAAEAVKDVNGGVLDTTRAVAKAYHQGLITIEKKDRLADLLIKLAKGGEKATGVLVALNKEFPDGNLPADRWTLLNKLLDDELISVFLDVLTELTALTPATADLIRIAMAGVRSAILILAGIFGRRTAVERSIERREDGIKSSIRIARLEVAWEQVM